MNRFVSLCFLSCSLLLGACTQFSADEESASASDEEIRASQVTFFQRSPLSGRRMESFRTEVEGNLMGHAWTLNQGTVRGLQWETKDREKLTLDATSRGALVQGAFASAIGSRSKKLFSDLKVVGANDKELGEALDLVGLDPSSASPESEAERKKLDGLLGTLARTGSITVMTGALHYQVDMYWENALIVVDEDNEQILVVTGGFGT